MKSVDAVSFGAGGKDGIGPDFAVAEMYRHDDIKRWQGTSIGGFVALLMANEFTLEAMITAMHVLWRPSLKHAIRAIAPRLINPYKLLRGDQKQIRNLSANLGLLNQTEHIAQWIEQHNLQWNNASLVLFDLVSRKLFIADSTTGMPVALALSATMAVPGIFSPVPWLDDNGKQHLFVDGGMRHMYPHVEGHTTAIVKALRFPGRDTLFKDTEGDVLFDVGVVPTFGILLPPSRKEIEKQMRKAQHQLRYR